MSFANSSRAPHDSFQQDDCWHAQRGCEPTEFDVRDFTFTPFNSLYRVAADSPTDHGGSASEIFLRQVLLLPQAFHGFSD